MMALGLRTWLAYGALGLTTAMLCTGLTATAGAVGSASQAAAQQTREWPSERPPRPLAAHPVKFPPYEIRKLSNGLQVVLVSQNEQPAVSVRMIVRAGAAQDPKGKMGLAMLTASLLDQGAAQRTAEQIADEVDFAGGILGTGAGTDLTYVNAIVMKDSLPFAFQMMADVVRRPTFAAEEVERQRQQAMSGLKVAADDPDTVANQIIDRLIYGFHPYGLPGSGTAESLATITRQDVVDFHKLFFVPNNALIAVVGDVSADEAMAGLEKAFGDWPAGDVPVFKPIDPPEPTKRVIVIDRKDAVQTEIRVGQLGIPRRHNDYLAMDQAVKILGGEGANRLQQVLRSQRGLTYGASADLQTYKTAGGIVAETDTRTEATAEALRLTVDEFWRLQRERVYDGELEGAQAYLAGHFPLTIETPDAIATQVLNQLFYELPLDELQSFPERVKSISPDEIQRVARSYLHPDRLAVVLVGDADKFAKDLKGVGFGEFERIPIDQVDLLSANLKRGGSRIGAAAPSRSPVSGGIARRPKSLSLPMAYQQTAAQAPAEPPAAEKEQIAAVIKSALAAHGGLDTIVGVKRLIAEAKTTLTTGTSRVNATTRTSIEYPDRVRVDAKLPEAEVVQVYADGKGWLRDPGGVHDAPEPMLKDFQAGVLRDPIALLRGAATGQLTVHLLPEETRDGRVLKVLSVSSEAISTVKLFFDAQRGTLLRLGYDSRGQGPTEEIFDDYRSIDGVSIPFKASIVRSGRVVLVRELTDVKINPAIAPDTFARPAR
jgi:zinc protease